MYDFFDREHAVNYLNGTIVRHGDTPTLVQGVDYADHRRKRLMVSHIPLRGDEMHVNKIEEFNFKPMRLGMYNFTVEGQIVEAAWMQRYPARRWKVGLDRQGVCVIPCRKAEDNVIFDLLKERQAFGRRSMWYCNEDMANMLERVYPTLLEALAIMGKRTRCSVAFSPNFAVTGTRKLMYRHNDQPVGQVEDGIPVLRPEYADLQEILQEDLNAKG